MRRCSISIAASSGIIVEAAAAAAAAGAAVLTVSEGTLTTGVDTALAGSGGRGIDETDAAGSSLGNCGAISTFFGGVEVLGGVVEIG